jgi:hypothetical protein
LDKPNPTCQTASGLERNREIERMRERQELSGSGEMHKYQKIHNGKRCITEKEVHNRKRKAKREK